MSYCLRRRKTIIATSERSGEKNRHTEAKENMFSESFFFHQRERRGQCGMGNKRCVGDQKASFTDAGISDYHDLHVKTHLVLFTSLWLVRDEQLSSFGHCDGYAKKTRRNPKNKKKYSTVCTATTTTEKKKYTHTEK